MENDDHQVGQILTRRDALRILGLGSAALLAACTPSLPRKEQAAGSPGTPTSISNLASTTSGLPSCVVRPAMTAGPYFVDEMLNRSDIRSDPTNGSVKDGLPLILKINVSRIGSNACSALPNARVDLWQCDASGVYSDAQDPSFNTRGRKFLRGYQLTDSSGAASFTTIYPGWYPGRTVHIHFKIRSNGYEFTSQLFFEDALSDQVFAQPPYSAKGPRTVRNADDGIFQNGGDQLTLDVTLGKDSYAAIFDIGLQM